MSATPEEPAGTRARRARQAVTAPSGSEATPFITINDCNFFIIRNWLEFAVLIAIVSLMMAVSFILPPKAGLDTIFPKLATLATGAMCSVSSFPLKPAFDRFSRVLLYWQARKTLQRNEPLSETLKSELRLLPAKKGFPR